MKKKRVTMSDIAEEAKVSKTIVSRAISDKYGVSPETRAKIMLLAHEMGYDFQKAAKKRSNRITLIVTSKRLLSDEYWRGILLGIEGAVVDNGYELDIVVYNPSTSVRDLLPTIVSNDPKGLFFVSDFDEVFIKQFESLHIPIVLIDSMYYAGIEHSQIRASNYYSSYLVGEYFMKMGHRRFAFFGDVTASVSLSLRCAGFYDAIRRHRNITFQALTDPGLNGKTYNTARFEEVFSGKERPTALFCASDEIACCAYSMFKKMNLRVPEDVSVIGFDNIELSKWITPELSTINVDKDKIGRLAFELMLEKLKNKDSNSKIVEVPSFLVERDSVRSMSK